VGEAAAVEVEVEVEATPHPILKSTFALAF
jgi:hypothetical protein